MSDFSAPTPNGQQPCEAALHDLASGGDRQAALATIARSEVLLPVPGEAPEADPQTVQLPVLETQDGTPVVPVFTSEMRLAAAMPEVRQYRLIPMAALGGGWPSDDLSLTIDPGSPDTLVLPASGVRSMPGLAGT